jgi:hypothetical protein
MQLEKYINQFPPGDQQEIRRLLEQYNSAVNAQDRALAQRRLEPFTRKMMQMPDMVGRRNFLDDAARQKYLKNTMGRETSEPIAAKFPAPRTAMDLIGSGMQSDQIRSLEKMGQAVNPMPPLQAPPAVQSRQMAGPPQQAQGPASPPRDTSPFNYKIPAAQTPPASQVQPVPAQGLLDTEEPSKGGSFYDDPMRMGLLQAGLGLMSAPRYSTNPNDVTLSSALARGLGGFVQGYGGTKKRLSEAEQDRLDQEFKRSQMELDRMYKMALTDESAARTARDQANITKLYEEEREAEQRKRQQIQTIMELQQGNATTLAQLNNLSAEKVNEIYEGVVAPSQETRQRQELINQIQTGDNLTPDQKKILVEYAQNEESKYKDVMDRQDHYAAKNRGPEQVSTAAFENWLGTQTELTDIERNLVLSEVQQSGNTDSGFASVQKIMNLKKVQKGDQPKDSSTMSGTIILQDPQSLANYRPEDYPGYQATKSRDRVLLKPMTADQLKAMNDKGAAAQAIDAYLQELEKIPGRSLELKYKALVENSSLSALRSKFIHAIMKLKDAYDLGVLSGNDYDLLESALNDPTKILTIRNKENFIKNVRQTGQQAYRSYAGEATLFNYDPLAYYSQYIANSYQLPSTLANPGNQEQARKNQALQGTTEDPDAYLLEPRP